MRQPPAAPLRASATTPAGRRPQQRRPQVGGGQRPPAALAARTGRIPKAQSAAARTTPCVRGRIEWRQQVDAGTDAVRRPELRALQGSGCSRTHGRGQHACRAATTTAASRRGNKTHLQLMMSSSSSATNWLALTLHASACSCSSDSSDGSSSSGCQAASAPRTHQTAPAARNAMQAQCTRSASHLRPAPASSAGTRWRRTPFEAAPPPAGAQSGTAQQRTAAAQTAVRVLAVGSSRRGGGSKPTW